KSTDILHKNILTIGVIGRLSITKGIDILLRLLELIKAEKKDDQFYFLFYGDVMHDVTAETYSRLKSFSNIKLNGFVQDKDKMYSSVDCVLHASAIEPLGRIFLEAIDYNKPFIGLNQGGIGEISSLLNLNSLMVNANE